jgi:hypothetical protein
VLGLEPAQDPGPVEPVVNEGVGHEQAHSGREPAFPLQVCSKQEVGKGHRDDLAPDPVHAAKRLKKSHSHPLSAIRSTPLVGCCKLLVNPAHQVALAGVAQEEEQGVGGLVQTTFPQRVGGKGAGVVIALSIKP